MQPQPRNAVEGLTALLQRWVDTAFPQGERSDHDVALLVLLWRELVGVIRGPAAPELEACVRESSLLEASGYPGAPPLRTLEHLLYKLIDAGVREYFLVIAVRQALDRLVAARFPGALAAWTSLADEFLPLCVQFGVQSDEGPPPTTTHAVGR